MSDPTFDKYHECLKRSLRVILVNDDLSQSDKEIVTGYAEMVECALSGYYASKARKVIGSKQHRYLAGLCVGTAMNLNLIPEDSQDPGKALQSLLRTLQGWVECDALRLSENQREDLYRFTNALLPRLRG